MTRSHEMKQRILCAAITAITIAALTAIAAPAAAENGDASIRARSTADWKTELVHSEILLDAKARGITLPTGRNAAYQILEMETPSLLKDTFFSITVNSSQRLGDLVRSGEISLTELNDIIEAGRKTPPVFSTDLKTVSMGHTVSIAQIGSLFIRHNRAYTPKIPLDEIASRPYSGILVDARGKLPVHGEYVSATLAPCLQPKLWSVDMDGVYDKNMVDPAIARARGIVSYQTSTDESLYEERIGSDPLRISAREVYGQYRTDPVISWDDYLKIITVPENRRLLAEGKVVIICDAKALEGGDLGPDRDDGYYFIRRSIEERLAQKKPAKMGLTDTWEGLKLMIYDIRFVADSARILDSEKSRLDIIAEALRLAGADATFTVEGHTASVGKPSGELSLSVQRAQAISAALAARGIEAKRLESTGYGGTRPVASNDTEEGRALNRRVEITVHIGRNRVD